MNKHREMAAGVIVTIIVTAAGLLAGPIKQEKQRKGSARVLLILDIDRTAAGDAVTSELSRRLVNDGISVTQLNELREKDRLKVRSAAAATLEKDRKTLKSFSFTAVIVGQFSTSTRAPFNGLYVSEARGTLKAIVVATGKTLAVADVPTVRGFGNSQLQANLTALENLAKELPQDFIDQVIGDQSN